MKIIIIGASHAGVTAALHLKAAQPDLDVILIEKNGFSSFIASGINLVAKEKVHELENASLYQKSDILNLGVDIIEYTEVIKLHKKSKRLVAFNSATQEEIEYSYDYLILATGSQQLLLDYGFGDDPRFISYKNLGEAKHSYSIIQKAKRVAIIGAGFIGLELADWLRKEKQVILIERMERPLFRYFDDGFLKEVIPNNLDNLTQKFNNSVTEIVEKNGQLQIHLLSGEVVENIDCVVSAVNGIPNTELFEDFIKLNFDHTVEVNEYLQTSVPYVYAIGDVIAQRLVNHQIENNRFFLPLVSNALRSAHVAAENILSNNQLPFMASNRTIVSLFGPYELGSAGLNELDLLTHPVETKSYTKKFTRGELGCLESPFVYTKVKLIYDVETKILLGGQIITTSSMLIQNINMISLMIHTKQTIYDIAQLDFFFQPEFKPYLNIIQQMALEIIRKINDEKRIEE